MVRTGPLEQASRVAPTPLCDKKCVALSREKVWAEPENNNHPHHHQPSFHEHASCHGVTLTRLLLPIDPDKKMVQSDQQKDGPLVKRQKVAAPSKPANNAPPRGSRIFAPFRVSALNLTTGIFTVFHVVELMFVHRL